MSKIWTQWMQRISCLVQGAESRDTLSQGLGWGGLDAQLQGDCKPQPSWLTPAYLRQRRSGDRISR
jgi:hypothetical protein